MVPRIWLIPNSLGVLMLGADYCFGPDRFSTGKGSDRVTISPAATPSPSLQLILTLEESPGIYRFKDSASLAKSKHTVQPSLRKADGSMSPCLKETFSLSTLWRPNTVIGFSWGPSYNPGRGENGVIRTTTGIRVGNIYEWKLRKVVTSSVVVKNMRSGARLFGFKSLLYFLLAVWPLACY